MKKILIIIIGIASFLGVSYTSMAQRPTTGGDTTKVNLAGFFKPTQIVSTSGTIQNPVYRVKGEYGSNNESFLSSPNVKAGMHFIDASFTMYRIITVVSATLSGETSNLTIDIKPVMADASIGAPSFLVGFIYKPTNNLLLPQWVDGMSAPVQGALLSHMANVLDTQFGQVSKPSLQIKTAAYTLADADDTVLFDLTAAGATLTLPAAATTNSGKTYKIGKVDNSTNLLTFSPAIVYTPENSSVAGTELVTIPTLNYARTFTIQSNGTAWYVVSQY